MIRIIHINNTGVNQVTQAYSYQFLKSFDISAHTVYKLILKPWLLLYHTMVIDKNPVKIRVDWPSTTTDSKPSFSFSFLFYFLDNLTLRACLETQWIHSVCAYADTQRWIFQKRTSSHGIRKYTVSCICGSKGQDGVATWQNSRLGIWHFQTRDFQIRYEETYPSSMWYPNVPLGMDTYLKKSMTVDLTQQET